MTIPRNWRTRQQRYSLKAELCHVCGNHIFPPRDVCPHCAEQKQNWTNLSGRGEIYSFTTMYNAPTGFEEYAPYTMALVKLAEGPMITAQLTDLEPAEVKIGLPVEMVTRKLTQDGNEGQILYGYKFRPLLRQAA
ncbi:MAG: Zn-ribbon domain-containing OB-fold protein [Chloroflexi bacterium]|nr:Zn-ribbon domain-containing OB-fold protein [Chloroflexota bacterium]